MNADEARAVLTDAGLTPRDVGLPGDTGRALRMGSLRLVATDQGDDGGIDVVAWDYGIDQPILRCRSLEEAVDVVRTRWSQNPEIAQTVTPESYAAWQGETQAAVEPIRAALAGSPGTTISTTLRPGMVVDRFGNLDGFLLYPAGTPLQARSLPPDVLDPERPDHGLVMFGVAEPVAVLAALVSPSFGQPGGGVMLKLAETSDTVRDLIARGELQPLSVDEIVTT